MPPPSPKAKMLESLRIPDGEGMPSPYNTTIRYSVKQSFTHIHIIYHTFRNYPHYFQKGVEISEIML